jgi:hypothetical protein
MVYLGNERQQKERIELAKENQKGKPVGRKRL